jgi:putative effector of murein hydrolase LrgA (UPF0299 family)
MCSDIEYEVQNLKWIHYHLFTKFLPSLTSVMNIIKLYKFNVIKLTVTYTESTIASTSKQWNTQACWTTDLVFRELL